MLLCPKPSSQSLLSWRFSNQTLLPPNIYLQTGDGRLVFSGSPLTVGRYICVSEERGFEQMVAIFSVKPGIGLTTKQADKHNPHTTDKKTSPTSGLSPSLTTSSGKSTRSMGSHTSTTREPRGYVITTQMENAALTSATVESGNGDDSLRSTKSYYGELVAVSILLVICVLMVGGLFWWHQRSLRQAPFCLGQEKAPSLGTMDT